MWPSARKRRGRRSRPRGARGRPLPSSGRARRPLRGVPRISPLVVGVEVSRRLVCEDDGRPRDERRATRPAAAGRPRAPGAGARAGWRARPRGHSSSTQAMSGLMPGELERSTFLAAVSICSRLKNWKMKPMCSRRVRSAACRRSSRDVDPASETSPDVGLVEPGEDVHERRLAGAGRAHHRGQAALGDVDTRRRGARRRRCRPRRSGGPRRGR